MTSKPIMIALVAQKHYFNLKFKFQGEQNDLNRNVHSSHACSQKEMER